MQPSRFYQAAKRKPNAKPSWLSSPKTNKKKKSSKPSQSQIYVEESVKSAVKTLSKSPLRTTSPSPRDSPLLFPHPHASIFHDVVLPAESPLLQNIRTLLSIPCQQIHPSIFKIENTDEAAAQNSKILAQHNFQLQNLVGTKDHQTNLTPGSEFRRSQDIEIVMNQHQDWEKIRSIIDEGVKYSIDDSILYTEEDRLSDIEQALLKGNNKSALSKESKKALQANYTKEVMRGWMLPILPSSISKINNASVIPIGVAVQNTVLASGERILKRRTTHDCSQPLHSGHSINNRIPDELLEDSFFGFCLLRILHRIHKMKLDKPHQRILLGKHDLDAAYRRLHVCLQQAVMSTTKLGRNAYLQFRLPFGVSEGTGKFSLVSDAITDLAQDIAERR